MDIKSLKSSISKIFIKGVHSEILNDTDNGGPDCADYMSWEFRLGCTALMVRMNNSSLIDCYIFCYLQDNN